MGWTGARINQKISSIQGEFALTLISSGVGAAKVCFSEDGPQKAGEGGSIESHWTIRSTNFIAIIGIRLLRKDLARQEQRTQDAGSRETNQGGPHVACTCERADSSANSCASQNSEDHRGCAPTTINYKQCGRDKADELARMAAALNKSTHYAGQAQGFDPRPSAPKTGQTVYGILWKSTEIKRF